MVSMAKKKEKGKKHQKTQKWGEGGLKIERSSPVEGGRKRPPINRKKGGKRVIGGSGNLVVSPQ